MITVVELAAEPSNLEVVIRKALLGRLDYGDDEARDEAWIADLADGLSVRWPGERLPNGDTVTTLDPELEARVEAAIPEIARRCQELAIEELVRLALTHEQRVTERAEYRARLLRPKP
jgi:hypothetical protein